MDGTIAIVDYRAGNLTSVARALSSLGRPSVVTSDATEIRRAARIVFPGVGAAGEAMRHLRELDLVTVLRDSVAEGKPFLGICLGYQILFDGSDEDGGVECLGILPGRVVRFPEPLRAPGNPRPLKVPHMGWNGVRFCGAHPVLTGIEPGSEFYFVHSYYPQPTRNDMRCGETDYGVTFTAGVAWKSLLAFQCHPEKSGRPGLTLLDQFCRWRG